MGYQIGSRIGDYEVLDILGAGGMGQVYKVRNVISDRVEAMKILLPNLEGEPELADRFMREIKVQASLDHPNIAALHTALHVNNQLLMLMEYVQGTTIEDLLKSGPIPIDKAVDYMAQVLAALEYAHAKGVIHRDIKPANMMLTTSGVIKLMDFGIAKLGQDRKLTQTGQTVGSLYYMSPEQIKGSTDLDPRADLYSLGISLYEVVTGARPFQGDSEYSIMVAHLEQRPIPPLQMNPSFPKALNDVVLMAIEKDPAKRFQTAQAFRNALLSVRNSMGVAPAMSGAAVVSPTPAPMPAVAPTPPPPRPAPAAAPSPTYASVPMAAPPPPPAPPSSRRGLYIAAGSLVTIAVLALAVTQAPKFLGTKAATTTPTQQSAPVPLPVNSPAPQAPAPAVETHAPIASQPASKLPVQKQPQQQAAQSNRQPPPQQAPQQTPAPMQPAPTNQQQQPPQQQQAPPPQQTPPPVRPAAPAVDTKALDDAREQAMQLAIRANSVRAGLNGLKQRQAGQGLGLRGDIVNAEEKMNYCLSETESALQKGDVARATKYLGMAETETSKLEKFLGR